MTLHFCIMSKARKYLPKVVTKDSLLMKSLIGLSTLKNDTGHRTLLSESRTRMDSFKRQRIFRIDYLQHHQAKGKEQLLDKLNNISTTDEACQNVNHLIDAMHCSQNKEDSQVVEKFLQMLMKSTDSKIQEFPFGSNVIRMYHYLNMPDEAFAAYKNPEFGALFKDNTCHQLLMDLLYKDSQYSRVVDIFFSMENFNIDCATLAFGALYHINSPESLAKSQSLLIHLSTNYAVSRRSVLFAAMHALKQGDPGQALEFLKFCKSDSVARNIELICLCKLHRVDDVLSHLHDLQSKTGDITKLWGLRIYLDAWQEVLFLFANHGTENQRSSFERLKSVMEDRGVLSQQLSSVFLEKTIPSDNDYKKERGKRILHRNVYEEKP